MKNDKSPNIRIKTKDEVRRTIQESRLIDRGCLPNRLAVVVLLVALGLCWLAPAWSMVPIGVLALDYAWFVLRRRRALRRYELGEPRLRTPSDFEAVAEAFKRAGVPEPTMTDWHEAAGFAGLPQWREDLRYRIAARHYRGGVLVDVGCGDGRLCWRYHACDPRNYVGVDVAPGLLERVSSKTEGQARTVLAVAENLGLPDESVDTVICSEAFEHLPEPGVALAEFSRVLRHNGRIVIQSPNALRLRNFNPFHLLSLVAGYWIPALLLPKTVHPNSFVHAFTYHWDFTRQDISRYARGCPGLSVLSVNGSTYRFNPEGSAAHRLGADLFRLRVVHWLGWDLTVVLQKR